jgi:hypothetical protein
VETAARLVVGRPPCSWASSAAGWLEAHLRRPRLVPVRPVGAPAMHVRLEFLVTARGDLL